MKKVSSLILILFYLFNFQSKAQETCEQASQLDFTSSDVINYEGNIGFDESIWYSITGDGSLFTVNIESDENIGIYIYSNDNCNDLEDVLSDPGLHGFYTKFDSTYLIEIVSEPVPTPFTLTITKNVEVDTNFVPCSEAELLSFAQNEKQLIKSGTIFRDLVFDIDLEDDQYISKPVDYYKIIGDGSIYGFSTETAHIFVDQANCENLIDWNNRMHEDEQRFVRLQTQPGLEYIISIVHFERSSFVPYELKISKEFEYDEIYPQDLSFIEEPYMISTSNKNIDHQFLNLEDDSCGNIFLDFTKEGGILTYRFKGDGNNWVIDADQPGTNIPVYMWLYEELPNGDLICKKENGPNFGNSESIILSPKNHLFFNTSVDVNYIFIIGGLHGEEGNIQFLGTNMNGKYLNSVEFCEIGSRRNNFEWIARVDINDEDIDHESGKELNGYGDYSEENLIAVDAGDSIMVSLTPGYLKRAYDEYWTIWIDWNYDGDFNDVNEMVFQQHGKGTQEGIFYVPNNVAPYNLRMRVVMKWKGYSPSGCSSFTNGEVQDYSIKVFGDGNFGDGPIGGDPDPFLFPEEGDGE